MNTERFENSRLVQFAKRPAVQLLSASAFAFWAVAYSTGFYESLGKPAQYAVMTGVIVAAVSISLNYLTSNDD